MARQQAPLPRRVRALLGFVCALVFVDTIFFTALTPLLPHYTHVANLTKAGAGLLVAAYPAGTLVARAARRPDHLPIRPKAGRRGRPDPDERLDAALRLVVRCGRSRRRAFRPGLGRRVHLGGGPDVAGHGRPAGTARGDDGPRARRGGGRRVVRPRGRGGRQPGWHRPGVLGRRGGRRRAHRGRVPGSGPGPCRTAGTAGGLARDPGPPRGSRHVADHAGRGRVRGIRRTGAAAAEQAGRLGRRHRGDVPGVGGDRDGPVTTGRPTVGPAVANWCRCGCHWPLPWSSACWHRCSRQPRC